MSMFRSAAEISSSDSDSDSGSEISDLHQGEEPFANGGENDAEKTTSSHPTAEPNLPPDALDVNVERHANVMTAALLEFYCLSRATDILNAQHGSKTFTRQSPESQYLGKQLYKYKSQFLSSHGVLEDGIDKEEWGVTRQNYRDNLDLLGLSALEEMNLNEPQRRSPLGVGEELALISKSSMGKLDLGGTEDAAPFWRTRGGTMGIRKQLPSMSNVPALEGHPVNAKAYSSSSIPLSSSVGVPLFNVPVAQPFQQLSRYSVEFSELRVLGRGSFGEVYHVKNHIDGQDYAVKKIPLSQRRLDQLQYGGQNHLETIMKEIRTLARLEHTNIVRYYGAWIEQAHVANHLFSEQHAACSTYEYTQADSMSQGTTNEPSLGIVFEHSEGSVSASHSGSAKQDDAGSSDRIQRWDSHATTSSRRSRKSSGQVMDDDDDIESIPRNFSNPFYGQTSTLGRTDDIFTDGLSQDQSKLQMQHRPRSGQQPPAVILHIQMSLHPISLGSYLNPQAAASCGDGSHSLARRHCFHLMPSLRLMLDIVSGVEYLHSKGIVHRDLKPANIFLSTPENHSLDACASCNSGHNSPVQYCHPRIGDFGLVANISHLNEASSEGALTPYRHGPLQRVVGTEFYRPPANGIGSSEKDVAIHDYKIDEKLDVYALGVILFELVYRLNTKMERQLVLNDLTCGFRQDQAERTTSFPSDFAAKVDLGSMTLDGGQSVAESLMECIRGMLAPQSQRWSCRDVKEHLRNMRKLSDCMREEV